MVKIIRVVLIILLAALIGLGGFQWRNYQKKKECRDNGLLYFKEEDYEKSITYLKKGLKGISMFGKEMDEDMSCYLAESYYRLGEYEEAARIYKSLRGRNSGKESYYVLEAEAYMAMEQRDKAVELYEKGWKNTGSSVFLSKICDAYIGSEDYEEALRYADLGLEKDEENAGEFLFKKIVIYEKCEDYSSAYETAVQYTALYPDDEKGLKELKFLETRI